MISEGIRDMKKDIYLTDLAVKDVLQEKLNLLFVRVLEGKWKDMTMLETEKISAKGILEKILNFFRGILIAIVPFGIFWLFQKSSYALEEEKATSIGILLLLWLIISIVKVIDPEVREKTSILTDITKLN